MGEIRVKFGKLFSKSNLYFLAILLAASLAVFLFFRKEYAAYETETSIIAITDETTFETLMALPEKLSFYDGILKTDQSIRDNFAGYPEDKRKKMWDDAVNVEREEKSSIIKIRIKDVSRERSLQLSEASKKTLIDSVNEIYDRQDNVKLQIIEGPISYTIVDGWQFLTLFSLLSGLAFSLVIKLVLSLVAKKDRLATLTVGWLTDRATNWAFEYVLYPIVIGYFGLVVGGLWMIGISITASLAVIKLYDYLKIDWLGIEKVKEFRDGEAQTITEKIIQWAMKKGDIFALVAMSILSEPTKVTLYMRRGSNKFNGFSRRDWVIFLTSVVIGNVSWAIAVFGGLSLVRKLF